MRGAEHRAWNELQRRTEIKAGERSCRSGLLRRKRLSRLLGADRHGLQHLDDAVYMTLIRVFSLRRVIDDCDCAFREDCDAQVITRHAEVILDELRVQRGIRTRNLRGLDERRRGQTRLLHILDDVAQQRLAEPTGKIPAERAKAVDQKRGPGIGIVGGPSRGLSRAAAEARNRRVEFQRRQGLRHREA